MYLPSFGRDGARPLARFFVALATLLSTLLAALPTLATPQLEATLTSPATDPFAGFGSALDLDGDRLVVGAPWQSAPDNGALHVGAAYVFEHQNGAWVQDAELTALDGDNEDFFGHAVGIAGDYVVVGAPWESDAPWQSPTPATLYRGAAYVFQRTPFAWAQVARLDAGPGEAPFAFFGHAVAIDGTTVVVGAPGDGDDPGAVHIFNRVQGTWQATQTLDSKDPGGRFGSAVALRGDYLSVAERGGASWRVYRRSASTLGSTPWVESMQFADNAEGFANALHGTDIRVAVGAPGDDATVAGQVHFFGKTPTVWTLEEVEAAATTSIGDRFGAAVAVDGHFAIVGAPGRDVFGQVDAGSAYLFDRDTSGNWQEAALLNAGAIPDLRFGAAVAIEGTTIAVGAPGYAQQESDDGQVRIFRLPRAARFSVSEIGACPPMELTFTDHSVGDITSRTWDVDGDGTIDYTNPGPVFSHTYTSEGTYDIILTVTGTGGSDSEVRTVEVAHIHAVWCPPTK